MTLGFSNTFCPSAKEVKDAMDESKTHSIMIPVYNNQKNIIMLQGYFRYYEDVKFVNAYIPNVKFDHEPPQTELYNLSCRYQVSDFNSPRPIDVSYISLDQTSSITDRINILPSTGNWEIHKGSYNKCTGDKSKSCTFTF